MAARDPPAGTLTTELVAEADILQRMDEDFGGETERSAGIRQALSVIRLAVSLVASAGRKELGLAIALTVISALLTAAQLLIGRQLVDLLVASGTAASELLPWLVLLGVSLVGTALANSAGAELQILLSDLVHRRAMSQLLDVATAAELEDFEDPEFHDRLRRAREHSNYYAWEVVWGLVTVLSTLLSLVAIVVVLLGVAPVLVPIALVAYVPIAFVRVRNTRALYRLHYELTELDRDREYHERLLTGRVEAKEIRAFGLGSWLRRRHDELFDVRVRNTRRVVGRRTLLALIGSSISAVILVGALAVVMVLALQGHLGVGDAAVAVVALQQLSGRLRSTNDAATGLVEGVAFLRDFESMRSMAFVRRQSADAADEATRELPTHPGSITVEDVSYRYPAGSEPALVDVSLQLTPGQTVAIVGPNGAGKTTLAKLLCGLLPPTTGTIWWDDVDTARCDRAAMRRRVAPVFQDFTRYEHTAAESIGFGDVERLNDRERVSSAANLAGADDFLTALPRGYDTRLSTSYAGGTDLSVGQWQRIAIARAFFRDAPLVVMDEPAASLDPRAERDLFAHLHELGRDRMVVFISHRFATVHRADHIVVLLDGRIAEQGTHGELMSLGGVYAELYTMQAEQFR